MPSLAGGSEDAWPAQSARPVLWVGNSLSECHKMKIWLFKMKNRHQESLWENKKGDPNS
jgi:hypothetical protein